MGIKMVNLVSVIIKFGHVSENHFIKKLLVYRFKMFEKNLFMHAASFRAVNP
jgi:hypothetical protein